SSVMPSLKYSCCGSPLRLANGSTATAGRSPNRPLGPSPPPCGEGSGVGVEPSGTSVPKAPDPPPPPPPPKGGGAPGAPPPATPQTRAANPEPPPGMGLELVRVPSPNRRPP